jgi:hypothetical protein
VSSDRYSRHRSRHCDEKETRGKYERYSSVLFSLCILSVSVSLSQSVSVSLPHIQFVAECTAVGGGGETVTLPIDIVRSVLLLMSPSPSGPTAKGFARGFLIGREVVEEESEEGEGSAS